MTAPVTTRLNVYIGSLCLGLIAGLVAVVDPGDLWERNVAGWIVLTGLVAATESADLSFHHGRHRWGLSAVEAVLLPMLVGLTPSQTILGVTAGILIVRLIRWKAGIAKLAFNVAEYGVGIIGGVAVYDLIATQGAQVLTVRNAVAATVAVLAFAVITHLLVAGVYVVSGQGTFVESLEAVGAAAGLNLAGNIVLGLFFCAAYVSAEWTVALFPLPLLALYLGYRAVLRQQGERERVEHLHAASRALAAGRDLDQSLAGFTVAVPEMVSAAEARIVVARKKSWTVASARKGEAPVVSEIASDDPLVALIERFRSDPSLVMVNEDEGGQRELLELLELRNLIAVPLLFDNDLVGCLLVADRVGAEEFGLSDARLLEALANELVLTLDSYRLFEQVAEERERFQKIFEGSKEGIALLDEEGVIQAWNPALERITGYHEEDILGERWSERVLVRDMEHRRIEGMDIVQVAPDEELEVVTRQGPPRWVSLLTGQVHTGDEQQWVVIVRDITAEHEIEEAKSDFLSTISHELRTPLTTIKGSLQMLGRPAAAPQSDVGKQMVDIMRRGADRLERLVMNLLTVSQMETGTMQVFPDEVGLRELVESRIKTVLIDHPQVTVTGDEDVVVRADRERLGQVVEHLLDNARKFGGPEGLITIDIAQENGYAHLTVTDEGPGIPRSDQDRVFDRFTRLGHLLTRETQGAGVGLFIAKTAVEAMSGEIYVESDGHLGSTFHVRIPLAQPVAVQEPATSA